MSMAINVAARQLQEPDFPALLAETLAQTGMPPELLVLELTETALLDDDETTAASIAGMKALGYASRSTTSVPATRP